MSIKVGFVGAGGRARNHMRTLQGIKDAEIVGICDVNEATAKEAVSEYGGRAYTDYHTMLDKEDLTAMYVVVPTFAHYDAEILAAQKGIHLMLEKPVAPSMEKAMEILEAVKKAGVLTSVGYQLRYSGWAKQGHAFFKDKALAMVMTHRWGGLPGTPWWRVMAKSGGQLVEQTTHQIDLLRYFAGDVREVHAYYATQALADVEDLDIPDVYAVTMKFESGAVGTLSSTCALREGGGASGIDIVMRDMRATVWAEGVTVFPKGADDPGPIPENADIDEVFMNAIRTGDGSGILSDLEEGIRSLDVSLAANKSAETGQPQRTYFSQNR
ncbi:MAG: Gfo/Idh/MocA family oxidoreductase [bacterium]|jgi:predicted dehydrogenase|nr:Gfo/Idh/MocA family oxidoreductase [bacterium]